LFDLPEIGLDSVAPGDILVVAGLVVEAAVQDADPAVRERSECLVVRVARSASPVVERAGARTRGDRRERPLVERVSETTVANEPGKRDVTLA
jgi:hypothetical protein